MVKKIKKNKDIHNIMYVIIVMPFPSRRHLKPFFFLRFFSSIPAPVP